MRYLSICSGIEAASVAWEPLGFTASGFSEIDPFASAVLAERFGSNLPGEPLSRKAPPNFGDFTAIPLDALGPVDLLVGGTPCQAFSFAGKRLSLADARGNLTLAFAVLAHELARSHGLRNALWENVPGVLSTPDNAFGCFLGAIVGADAALDLPAGIGRWPDAGMVAGPRARAAWRVLDAQYFGLAQRRERVFVVVDFGNGADPAAVLFEPQGLQGNSPPRREAGQVAAPTVAGGARSRGGYSTDDVPLTALAFGGNNTAGPIEVSTALNAHGGPMGRMDFESETFIAFQQQGSNVGVIEDVVGTLLKGNGNESGGVPCIAFDTTQITSKANRSNPKAGDPCHPLAASAHAPAIAFDARQSDVLIYGDMTGLLDTKFPGPAIAFSCKDHGADAADDLAPTLRAMGHGESHANAGGQVAVLYHEKGDGDASASETNAGAILRALRQEIGAEAFAQWGLGILDSLQSPEVLRSEVHGSGLRHPAQAEGGLVGITQAGSTDEGAGALREVRCAGRERRAPSGSRLAEQRAIELGEALSLLSHPGASRNAFLLGLWEASEGAGVLRQALSAVQEVRRSSPVQGQSAYAGWAVRRLMPHETARLQGFPDHHARIAWRGKPAELCPDGPQYKTYGNSMAVTVMRWLGERLAACQPTKERPSC